MGTDNARLLDDPLYLGVRRPRLRGTAYFELLDEFVDAVRETFPHALIQWEDFAKDNAFVVLDRLRERVQSFDDDIQGTGAVIPAGLVHALRVENVKLADARVVIFGLGAAGGGIARQISRAMRQAGVPAQRIPARLLAMGRHGLILPDGPHVRAHQRPFAADPELTRGWPRDGSGRLELLEVVRNFRPDALIGTSAEPGAFARQVVVAMRAGVRRPIIFTLSNPTDRAEATPADLLAWTAGAALVAAGSPSEPVQCGGVRYEIGRGNNALAFPGIGLGALAVRARGLPDAAFSAAARAFESMAPPAARGRDC